MITVYDVETSKLIKAAAEELKKNEHIKAPAWAQFVKTGVHRERVPDSRDWWYTRVASLLRKIYLRRVGVSRLRTVYGGRKHRGHKPERFFKASGNILRKGLQQLEAAGYVKKTREGRQITAAGQKFLESMAFKVSKEK